MTTEVTDAPKNFEKLSANMAKLEELSQRLVAALAKKREIRPALQGPGPDLYAKAATAYWTSLMTNPSKMIEAQASFWGKSLSHFIEAQQMLAQGKLQAPADPGPSDPRFKNPLWDTHPYFNFIKQQYLLNAKAIGEMMNDLDGLDSQEKRRVKFFAQQMVDLMSPTNFLGTNPEALEHAVETDGQSLVDGLENLVHDIEAHEGDLVVELVDKSAFEVGGNIATTPGEVIFRNRMMELIQYTPTTETVHKTPLVIFPPWINKYYILDLKPANSLIKFIVDQGYTLFVVSWVNPDGSYRDVSIDTYIEEGYFEAIRVAKEITGEDQVNAVGYCIGGTVLSLTLALMEKRGDKSVASATFFTTLTDFIDPGEVEVFLDEDFVDGIEEEAMEKGVLESFFMSRTFSFLRANDLVYGPAIKSYMMGKTPPAFDLLYWNGDGSNLPAKMFVQYLRELVVENRFAHDGIEICGETLKVGDIKTPFYAISCETDHIAVWRSCFEGFKKFGSRSKTFILSESGHIAGIVNPPSKVKYGHYTNEAKLGDPDEWLAGATEHAGSWWPRWEEWLAKRSGKAVEPRVPGEAGYPALAPAPGTYVRKQVEH